MKRIIVNVSGLTIEEKQRVSETLAKIKNINMCNPLYWDVVVLLYGPSSDGVNVGFGYYEAEKTTHTPQQVLEMAGMAPSDDQHVFFADMLIITDSSGNIVYDSTLDVAKSGKGWALPDSGVRVKLDDNGVAVMVEKRKVRTGFDKAKEYSVDVSMCSEEEKKEVQQAFFDVGILWVGSGAEYPHLDKVQYTNTTGCGQVTMDCMFGSTTEDCNMTAKEFLELVYEPEQQGHIHADLMAQYAEDAKTTDKPWELWQIKKVNGVWDEIGFQFIFDAKHFYRRKPKTHIVNGVEVPDLRFEPKEGDRYYLPEASSNHLYSNTHFIETSDYHEHRKNQRLCYEYTEAGKQAAILHAKIMLGIHPDQLGKSNDSNS